jgi:RNA polymerase sigma-54 factor
MKLEQKLEYKLSPILLQRLDLLALPQLELQQLIKQMLEENPLLEKTEEWEEEEISLPEEKSDWDVYPVSTEYEPKEEKDIPIPSLKPSLKEYLISQIRLIIKNQKLLRIAEHIIYELNEDGYLSVEVKDIANDLREDPKTVELVLKEIQTLEPLGVGARNLQECILIQLRAKRRGRESAILIVSSFFNDFMAQNYTKIKKELKIEDEDFKKAIECIKSCIPKPGKMWEGDVRYVIPEIVIKKEEGKWDISLTHDWLAKLRISSFYQEMLETPSGLTQEERKYLKEKWRAAKLLLQGIEKRVETITMITEYIVKNEDEFLNSYKPNSINLLTLGEVARAIGRDVSTVSRAIKDKWLQTPRGAIRFKTFFSGGKKKDYTEITYRLKELIKNEDKTSPLRDSEIAKILRSEGFKVARTTVIKYRAQLGIPNAKERKVTS